mmetsp:Transcript_14434/g.54457  ORF Transcript_14434/g.54457 Transcript_14434/m.54457 type:complete len:211 (-) Transcript_14434:24-656(-)
MCSLRAHTSWRGALPCSIPSQASQAAVANVARGHRSGGESDASGSSGACLHPGRNVLHPHLPLVARLVQGIHFGEEPVIRFPREQAVLVVLLQGLQKRSASRVILQQPRTRCRRPANLLCPLHLPFKPHSICCRRPSFSLLRRGRDLDSSHSALTRILHVSQGPSQRANLLVQIQNVGQGEFYLGRWLVRQQAPRAAQSQHCDNARQRAF